LTSASFFTTQMKKKNYNYSRHLIFLLPLLPSTPHLTPSNRLLRERALNRPLQKRRVPENRNRARADEPEHRAEGTREEAQRDRDDHEGGVQLRGRGPDRTELQVAATEPADPVHAADHHEDDEQEEGVGQEGVDGEHEEDDGVVGGVVAQVVGDAGLGLAEGTGLRDHLDVEEFAGGAEVGEPLGDGPALEAGEVEAVGEH